MPRRTSKIQWRCLCEGDQEIWYLKRLQALLREQGHNVAFEPISIRPTPNGISTALWQGINYGVVALFDHDGLDSVFKNMVKSCKSQILPAYSNRCFDLWLLLHREDYFCCTAKNDAYVSPLRTAFELGANADVKTKANNEKILAAITLEDVRNAVQRATRIREGKLPSDGKRYGKHVCYDNPDLMVQEFVKIVFQQCKIHWNR